MNILPVDYLLTNLSSVSVDLHCSLFNIIKCTPIRTQSRSILYIKQSCKYNKQNRRNRDLYYPPFPIRSDIFSINVSFQVHHPERGTVISCGGVAWTDKADERCDSSRHHGRWGSNSAPITQDQQDGRFRSDRTRAHHGSHSVEPILGYFLQRLSHDENTPDD